MNPFNDPTKYPKFKPHDYALLTFMVLCFCTLMAAFGWAVYEGVKELWGAL